MNKSTKQLAEKIEANSFWPVDTPTMFYFSRPGEAEEVTEAGRKALKELEKHIDIEEIKL